MSRLWLLPGKEGLALRFHPWIFEGSVDRVEGRSRPGDTVSVYSAKGQCLGKAAYSPVSRIRARFWSFDPEVSIDHAFFKRAVAASVARRQNHPWLCAEKSVRLIHGEADGLPGVIADRYGETLVLQLTSAGAEKWREPIIDGLMAATGCTALYERSDSEVRKREGLEPLAQWQRGGPGASFPEVIENGIRMRVDVEKGHKTGFYLDQRENRILVSRLAKGRRVLNGFCYSGGFSLQALAGGASEVLSIDSSAPALEMARENLALNPQLDGRHARFEQANVFEALRELKNQNARFDLIILDPPKLAPSSASLKSASKAYKDLHLLGFRLLSPGGFLMTYSCSGTVSAAHFQGIAAEAAKEAGVSARILQRLSAAPDHPIGLAVPESEYLKGLLCQIDACSAGAGTHRLGPPNPE
jgi:23S rRNA (cytosine1962-C5)-methyltransferase